MKRKWLGLALAAAMACAGTAWADILAQDSAANYSDEYPFVKDSNGGSGFAGWEFPDVVPALADSAAGACGDINSANGLSFRVARDGSTDWCHIYRGFEALNPGDAMTLKFTCAWDGGGRGIDLFAGGDQIANAVNLGPGNNLSVNGETVSEEYADKAVYTLVLAQEADGITISLARVPAEEGGAGNVAYFTKVETDKKLSRIGFYAGGWEWNEADVDNYALFVNDLKIEGTPPADKLSLSGPDEDAWKVLSATETLEFTVSRTGSEGDMDVALASSFPEFVSVPDGVTIADGAASATFPVTVALQGYGNEASISATATGVAGADYGLKGPQYKMSAQNDGKVEAETESNFWVNWVKNDVRDDSKLTLDVEPEGALTVTDPSTWTWIDEDGGAYVASQFTAHESGRMILKFDGVEIWSQDVTVIEAGVTFDGPTTLRLGSTGTYVLDVTLTEDMSDTFSLVADPADAVEITPASTNLVASDKIEFSVKALSPGDVKITANDTEFLCLDLDPIVLTITEAPDYVAYDDASFYAESFDYAAVGVGTDKFQAWENAYLPDAGSAGAKIFTSAPDESVLTDGKAFAIYANGGDGAEIQLRRPFVKSLGDGQAFSVVLSPDWRDGTKGLKFMGYDAEVTHEWWQRAEFYYNNDGYFYKLEGDSESTSLGWDYGTEAVTITLKKEADGSGYTLSFARGDAIVVKEGITSFGGTIDAVQFYSWQGGDQDQNHLVFNSLAIEQVEKPIITRAIGWGPGDYNPEGDGTYAITLTATTEDIGSVGLSVEPGEGTVGTLTFDADTLDLSGKTSATISFTLAGTAAGDSFRISATPADTTVAALTGEGAYGVSVSGAYLTLWCEGGGEFTTDTKEIWLSLSASPSRYGTYTLQNSDSSVIALSVDSVTIPDAEGKGTVWFNVFVKGVGSSTVSIVEDESANWNFTISQGGGGNSVAVTAISVTNNLMTLTLDKAGTAVFAATKMEDGAWKWQALDIAIVGDGTSVTVPMDDPNMMLFRVE